MSREAIMTILTTDSGLNALNVNSNSVFQGQGMDERPASITPFVLVRWMDEDRPVFGTVKPPRRVMIWVHWPVELSNDYSKIDKVLDKIEDVLLDMQDVAGGDGYTVSNVSSAGRSPDLKDEGLQTFCRWAMFEVLSRKAVTV